MIHPWSRAGLALCAAVAVFVPVPAPRPARSVYEFRHVTVVDVIHGTLLPDRNVIVRDNRIIAIRPGVAAASGDHLINASGRYLIPGLWDMHVHLAMTPDSMVGMIRRAREIYFPRYLAAGVTGVRDMGSWLDTITAIRRSVRDGTVLGPRIVMAGRLLGGKNPWAPLSPHAWVVTSAEEAKLAVDSLQRAGADFIKVHDLLSRNAYMAIAKAAREARLPLVGHLRPDVPVADVIAAGQVGFEHVGIELAAGCTNADTTRARAFYGAWIAHGWKAFVDETASIWADRDAGRCAAMFGQMREAGVRLTPTFVLRMQDSAMTFGQDELIASNAVNCRTAQGGWGALPDTLRAKYYRIEREIVRAAHDAGVAVMIGTDGPEWCLAPGISVIREMRELARAGLQPIDVLRAATLEPARFLKMTDSLGSIEPGKVADLVLLASNPLASLDALERPVGVMSNGRWLDVKALARMRDGANAAVRAIGTVRTRRAGTTP
ncbi:MAG: amidohydrolase [Gemmatimonadetes bacterium]|nr:amidohydrolase [Gemmatimonadota bacterium]